MWMPLPTQMLVGENKGGDWAEWEALEKESKGSNFLGGADGKKIPGEGDWAVTEDDGVYSTERITIPRWKCVKLWCGDQIIISGVNISWRQNGF